MNIDHSAINMQNIAISELEDPTSPSVFSTSIRITISTVERKSTLPNFLQLRTFTIQPKTMMLQLRNITHLDRSRSKGGGSAD